MRRVLLTGATGFVGRHCPAELLSRGFEVHAVSSRGAEGSEAGGVTWHRADLLGVGAARELVGRLRPTPSHLAWTRSRQVLDSPLTSVGWPRASTFERRSGGARRSSPPECAEYELGGRGVSASKRGRRSGASTLYGAEARLARCSKPRRGTFERAWGRSFFFRAALIPRRLSFVTLALL